MPLSDYHFSYEKERFQEDGIRTPSVNVDEGEGLEFCSESKALLKSAIMAIIQEGDIGKTLPLQGVIDLARKTIYLAALTPRDEQAVVFQGTPLFEHKQAGLFEAGQYSPRLRSYQSKYSDGPTAHQQLLFHSVKKNMVSADHAKDKRGIALKIRVQKQDVIITVDGKSLSINETAQYLRTKHPSGHELSDEEARNDVLKASKIFSPLCESSLYEDIVGACDRYITNLQQEAIQPTSCLLFQSSLVLSDRVMPE